ncbi:MAG: isoprenoid biosynthesis glyoxalase ElbB [Bacilli bacterium]|nr:isoprenoid biosynthesis glyoxalase ElbB [Bacilli bacterium]
MKYAVMLSGCGIGDGSQIEETVLTYLTLEKNHIQYIPTAPNRECFDVVNHYDENQIDSQTRNILVESARMGKGMIVPLDKIEVDDYDGLIIIGGMGVYKNLTNFVDKRNQFTIYDDVDSVIKAFYKAKKPIGTMCAGIILVAKSLSELSDDLHVGMVGKTFYDLFEQLGVTVAQIRGNESYADFNNKVVNTPAFLGTQKLEEILDGIESMVKSMRALR